jgi:hypothetical protein
LFLIEGVFTGIIGVSAFFFMPASPTQTAGRLRGRKSWFTERYDANQSNQWDVKYRFVLT